MSQKCIEAVVIKTETPDGELLQVFEKGGGIIIEQKSDSSKNLEVAIDAIKRVWDITHNPMYAARAHTLDDVIRMYQNSIK